MQKQHQLFETSFLKGGKAEWMDLASIDRPRLSLPNAELYHLFGGWGHMDFLGLAGNGYYLYCNKYKIDQRTVSRTRIDQEFFEISIILKGGGTIDMNGTGEVELKPKQCSIAYTPYTDCKTTLCARQKGVSLDFYLTYDQMHNYFVEFPETIGPLLEAAQTKRALQKTVDFTPYLSDSLYSQALKVYNMIELPKISSGIIGVMMDISVDRLLRDTFRHMRGVIARKLSRIQEEKLISLWEDFNEQYAGNPMDIESAALYIDMPSNQFKGAIKDRFDRNGRQFILELRMNFARKMIVHGFAMPEIAFRLGYSRFEAFSQTFKRLYGISPMEYKHDWNKRKYCNLKFGLKI